jgi:hypothetical protein
LPSVDGPFPHEEVPGEWRKVWGLLECVQNSEGLACFDRWIYREHEASGPNPRRTPAVLFGLYPQDLKAFIQSAFHLLLPCICLCSANQRRIELVVSHLERLWSSARADELEHAP